MIGSVRTTDGIRGAGNASGLRYAVGPSAKVSLPLGFCVEADAQYSRVGYDSAFAIAFGGTAFLAHATSWECPILLKHRIPLFPLLHPYVSIGYSSRRSFTTRAGTGISSARMATKVSLLAPV